MLGLKTTPNFTLWGFTLHGSTTNKLSYRRLRQYAVAISIISVFYNCAESAVSIGLGYESSSRALVFFGIQSAIEVASSVLVLWRFREISKPGEGEDRVLGPRELRMEKYISGTIGGLLILLAIGTEVSAIVTLVLHQEPDISNASIIVSAGALFFMVLLWLPKRYLARELNSSAMQGEATCSLSCIQITIVLFIGSFVFRMWRGGWWVDSATSLLLGILFGWEGWKMVRWVCNPAFDGGCCNHCTSHKNPVPPVAAAELGEIFRDLCESCLQNSECRESEECKCEKPASVDSAERGVPTSTETKCCTRRIIQVPRHPDRCCDGDTATACCNTPTHEKRTGPGSCNGTHCATTGGGFFGKLRRMKGHATSMLVSADCSCRN